MVNTTTIAWAIPVKVEEAGAGVEAYVASKATVTTFRLCVKYGSIQGASAGRLPVEIVENVVELLREPFFEEMLQKWEKDIRCCVYRCEPREHFTEDELIEILRRRCSPTDCEAVADIWTAEEEGRRVSQQDPKRIELKWARIREALQDGCGCLDESICEDDEYLDRHNETVDALIREIGEDPTLSGTARFVRCKEVGRSLFLNQ